MILPEDVPSNPIFSHLQKLSPNEVARLSLTCDYAKHDYIVLENDLATHVHIIVDGIAKCVKTSPKGRSVTLKLLFKGDTFSSKAYPGSIQAISNVRILKINFATFSKIIFENGELALQWGYFLATLLRQAHEAAAAFALYTAKQRLALVLLSIVKRAGTSTSGGIRLDFPLTRDELADLAGLTPDTTSRMLTQFRQERLIEGAPRSLLIRDMEGLQRV